ELRGATLAAQREDFAVRFDDWRRGVIEEPRGGDVWVGALKVDATDPTCVAGVIFFNNAGPLLMCGHGMMGFVVTLGYLGLIGEGTQRIETPVGVVTATLEGRNRVTIENVPSWREAADFAVEIEGVGEVKGDVAWGGNWFYLVHGHGLEISLENVEALTAFAWKVREAVNRDYPEVDHIELLEETGERSGRNFVLCPGKAYDRSPCGTGTSATMACRYAAGLLGEGETWRQESVVGSVFEGSVRDLGDGKVAPTVAGEAYVNGDGILIFDESDPFCWGIR
ncbi:MAG: proline racemase family protein, partial [Verrucomicrobiales bacterium]|nr:proline racemase family protein [Verrucomicrobiales bacterium]